MILEARNDFIILKLTHVEQVSSGGIAIAHTADTELVTGVVLSVGSGRMDLETHNDSPCDVGETVVFNQHTGHTFPPEYGDDLICVRLVDIIGVIAD